MMRLAIVAALSTCTYLLLQTTVVPQTPEAAPAARRSAAAKLMSSQREQLYRKFLPRVDDPEIQRILDDPRLIVYTEAEMPRAYQDWDGALQGVHSARYNISADPGEPHGNGNIEFPWGTPAGTHRSPGVQSFRFVWLPVDSQGATRPIVWFRRLLRGDRTTGYAWRYPVGTVFGEVLMLTSPSGTAYTFEMRLRTREWDSWQVDVFRPFPRAKDLADRVRQLRPGWQEQPSLARLVEYLDQPKILPVSTLADRQPGTRTFAQTAGVDVLPPVEDDRLVAELLTTTPFKSSAGEVWRRDAKGTETFAPTTQAPFHVVPARYDGGFIEVDSLSCMRCHETVNHSVRRFDLRRDWYGRIRGSDGIFSFHPFAPNSISQNGFGNTIQLRAELVAAGLLERYDPQRHPAGVYSTVPTLTD